MTGERDERFERLRRAVDDCAAKRRAFLASKDGSAEEGRARAAHLIALEELGAALGALDAVDPPEHET